MKGCILNMLAWVIDNLLIKFVEYLMATYDDKLIGEKSVSKKLANAIFNDFLLFFCSSFINITCL